MSKVTIHTYDRMWEGAQVVGSRYDRRTGEHPVLIVRHPHFNRDMDFFVQPDNEGRHLNIGNNAFWVTIVE